MSKKDDSGSLSRKGDKVSELFADIRDTGLRPSFGKKFEAPKPKSKSKLHKKKRCVVCRKGKVADDSFGKHSHCAVCRAAYFIASSVFGNEALTDIPCKLCGGMLAKMQGKYLVCPQCGLLYLKEAYDERPREEEA